jgi:hypothetical protein
MLERILKLMDLLIYSHTIKFTLLKYMVQYIHGVVQPLPLISEYAPNSRNNCITINNIIHFSVPDNY